jgi:hypothetical protein
VAPEAPETPEAPTAPEAPKEGNTGDGASTETEEYPDASMRMNLTELKQIADAYEVPYGPKTKKQDLVDAILEAQYPDGVEE